MAFPDKIINFFLDKFKNSSDEEKRRIALICTAVVVFLLVLSVLLSLNYPKKQKLAEEPETLDRQSAIPAEELFLPDEPDFIPGVLLERERRSSWTEQDALMYWQDPMIIGEEPWRNKIESVIDDFLEQVP